MGDFHERPGLYGDHLSAVCYLRPHESRAHVRGSQAGRISELPHIRAFSFLPPLRRRRADVEQRRAGHAAEDDVVHPRYHRIRHDGTLRFRHHPLLAAQRPKRVPARLHFRCGSPITLTCPHPRADFRKEAGSFYFHLSHRKNSVQYFKRLFRCPHAQTHALEFHRPPCSFHCDRNRDRRVVSGR